MNRKRVIYIGILLIVTVIVSITTFSYAFLTRLDEEHGKLNMVVGTLDYEITSPDLTNNSITLSSGELVEIELNIKSTNTIESKYKLYTNNVENVDIGYLDESGFDTSEGTISVKGTKKVKVFLENKSDTSKTVTFGVQGGFTSNTISLEQGRVAVDLGEIPCPQNVAYEFPYDPDGDGQGQIQEFTARCPGIYKLETWGAQGGSVHLIGVWNGYSKDSWAYGGNGGYSSGKIMLASGDTIYVGVGGSGGSKTSNNQDNGSTSGGGAGYNGGGSTSSRAAGDGGGATHIGKTNTLLKNTSPTDVYLVAGAGGGGAYRAGNYDTADYANTGGVGGGTTGGNGNCGSAQCNGSAQYGSGGTQTAAGTGMASSGGYGFGTNAPAGAGGGGYYGGGGGGNYNGPTSGGGGSSYIDGVIDGKTIAGNKSMPTQDGTGTMTGNSGNGYARITYLGNKKITFNPMGGTVDETIKAANKGSAIGTLPVPTQTDKYFLGWYLDENYNTKVDETYVVNSDITLYAKWDDIVVLYDYLAEQPASTTEEASARYIGDRLRITTSATNTANLGSRVIFSDKVTTGGVIHIKGSMSVSTIPTTTSSSKLSIGLGTSARGTDKGLYVVADNIAPGGLKRIDSTIEIPANTYVTIMAGRQDQNITGGTLNSTINITDFYISNY